MKKSFIRFVQCNASGNHCIIDTLDVTPFTRLHDYVEYFICAFLIHKNYPSLKYCAPKSSKIDTAMAHLKGYSNFWEIPFHEKNIDENFILKVFEKFMSKTNYLYFAHGSGLFTHSQSFLTERGNEKIWSLKYAKESSQMLKNIVSKFGYHYSEISVLRHPVDILLSRIERYGLNDNDLDEHSSQIREAFEIIKEKLETKMTPIIKYEEIVNEKGACLIKHLPFPENELKKIDNDIYYSKASINKRFKYSISKNRFLLNKLKIDMDWAGYRSTTEYNFIKHYFLGIKQYIVSTLSDIKLSWIVSFCGYNKVGQTFHHKLTFFARVFQKGFNIVSKGKNKLFQPKGETL